MDGIRQVHRLGFSAAVNGRGQRQRVRAQPPVLVQPCFQGGRKILGDTGDHEGQGRTVGGAAGRFTGEAEPAHGGRGVHIASWLEAGADGVHWGRIQESARAKGRCAARVAEHPGYAKVREHGLALPGEQHVPGRDIRVREAFSMQVAQGLEDGSQDGNRLADREPAAGRHHLGQRAAGGIIHGQGRTAAGPGHPDHVVRLDEVLVVQDRQDPDLPPHILFGDRRAPPGPAASAAEAFERAIPAGPLLPGQPDVGTAAPAQQPADVITWNLRRLCIVHTACLAEFRPRCRSYPQVWVLQSQKQAAGELGH